MKECQREDEDEEVKFGSRAEAEDKAEDDMGGRRGLGKVIVYRQLKPHAARRRKSITVDCASLSSSTLEV